MKYLFLAYEDETGRDAMSTNAREAFENDCLVNEEMLRENGHLLAVERLPSRCAAITVRVKDDDVCVTEGSFIETKQQLIGVFFINARDLNNAIYLASQMPQARGGSVEVRPMIEFDP